MFPEAFLVAVVALALAAVGFWAGMRLGRRLRPGRRGEHRVSDAAPAPPVAPPEDPGAADPGATATVARAQEPGPAPAAAHDTARLSGAGPETRAVRGTVSLEERLRRAVSEGELELAYEPILELASNRLVAFEAQLRWRIRPQQVLPVGRFRSLAEQTGLAAELDAWALGSACAQLRAWHDGGFPDLAVTLDLSAPSFDDPDVGRRVARVVAEHGLPPQAVELEVGERVAMRDPAATGEAFAALERRGVRLAIDDFGTAYSSLLYLRTFPIHTLKIDRSFVRGIVDEPADQEIAESLIRLAHALGVTVVGEGVENDAQIAALRRHGCDRAQGYRVSPPATATTATRLLHGGPWLPARDGRG